MFDDVAMQLLNMMGRRETIPSAIEPDDIPAALIKLRSALASRKETDAKIESTDSSDDAEASVSLGTRAGPLIELLEAAAREKSAVIWEGD